MAQTVTVNLEVKDNTKTLKQQYKEAVVELQNMVAAYGETSQQALKAAAAAAELKDTIEDTNDLIATQKGEGAFIATGKAIQAASSGLAAYEGALGLIGVESEALQETMLRVQSAMALAQGLEGLEDAGRAFKTLGVTIQNALVKLGVLTVAKEADAAVTAQQTVSTAANIAATEAQAAANVTAGASFKTMGTAAKVSLNGVKGAIAATGIGLLVVALGTIVSYWDDIKAAVGGVSKELQNNVDLSKSQVKQAEKGVELFDLQENSLRLQGKSETEILRLRQGKLRLLAKEQEEDIKLAENKKKLEVAAAKRNKELLEAYLTLEIEGIMLPFRVLAGLVDATMLTINAGLRALGQNEIKFKTLNSYMTEFREYATDGLASMIFDPEGIAKESDAEITALKTALAKTKSEIDGAELQIRDIKKESNKNQAEDKKEADMSMTEYLDALEAQRKAKITDAQQKELQALDDQYEALYAAADKAGVDTAELQKKHGEESRAIQDKYDKLALDALNKREQDQLKVMQEMDSESVKQFLAGEQIKIDAMEAGLDKEAAIRNLAYRKGQIELQANLDANLITMDQFQTASRANYKSYQDGLAADNKAANDKIKQDDESAYEQKLALQNQYADIAIQAANLLKDTLGKSKAAQKTAVIIESAAGIAKMVIANKLANLGALATPQAIASGGITAVPTITANNISLGLGIAANVAATAKALKEIGGGGNAPSGGGTGGGMATGGGAGGGVMAPSFNVVGNNGLNQLAQLQQQPVKAYVVGSEVSTQQALDRNRITNAQL